MTKFTARELAREAEKEIAYRRFVYPRLVDSKKMTPQAADRRLAMMEEIADQLNAQAEMEEAAARLL